MQRGWGRHLSGLPEGALVVQLLGSRCDTKPKHSVAAIASLPAVAVPPSLRVVGVRVDATQVITLAMSRPCLCLSHACNLGHRPRQCLSPINSLP